MDELAFIWPLFFFVGVVVSLDVFGLTMTQGRYFVCGQMSIWSWSVYNALWHAGLLLLYTSVISGLFEIHPLIIDGLARILQVLGAPAEKVQ